MNQKTTLQERIVLILSEQHLKKVELARSLGISPNYVSLLAAGKKTAISRTLAKLIETLYGYPEDWILAGTLPDPAPELIQMRQETLREIECMNAAQLHALSAYLHKHPPEEANQC